MSEQLKLVEIDLSQATFENVKWLLEQKGYEFAIAHQDETVTEYRIYPPEGINWYDRVAEDTFAEVCECLCQNWLKLELGRKWESLSDPYTATDRHFSTEEWSDIQTVRTWYYAFQGMKSDE